MIGIEAQWKGGERMGSDRRVCERKGSATMATQSCLVAFLSPSLHKALPCVKGYRWANSHRVWDGKRKPPPPLFLCRYTCTATPAVPSAAVICSGNTLTQSGALCSHLSSSSHWMLLRWLRVGCRLTLAQCWLVKGFNMTPVCGVRSCNAWFVFNMGLWTSFWHAELSSSLAAVTHLKPCI